MTASSTITPEELSTLRSRIGQDLVTLIQTSALHGGRKIPKTTLVERGISLDLARDIIMKTTSTSINDVDQYNIDSNKNNDHTELMEVIDVPIISDTNRQVRWKVDDDSSIVRILGRDERLIHPVKHDGSGFYVFPTPATSSSTEEAMSSSSTTTAVKNRANSVLYHWARFVSLEVRYDKREMTLVYIAKTVAAGIGRPERAVDLMRYSRGERDDLPY